jgi:hypothetical protein
MKDQRMSPAMRRTLPALPPLPATARQIIMPHEAGETKPVKTYLFACVHNAGRSQMAAAFFNVCADAQSAVRLN